MINNVFKKKKNETDTDLALLKAYTFAPQEIVLTGVTGGRLDHYEAAVRSIYRLQKEHPQIELKIINHTNMLQFLLPGTHTIYADDRYRYLSFFAHEEPIQGVTLRQVKYETTNEEISLGTSRFTSNEIIGTSGSISFSQGICLMIRSIDWRKGERVLKVYTFQLPKFVSSITRTCINLFKKDKKVKKSD